MSRFIHAFLFCCSLLAAIPALAQQTPRQFTRVTDYLLYLPDGYNNDTTQRWPLILFLHGAGERGDDIQKVAVHGPAKLAAAGRKFPFIIVSPQCKSDSWWEPEALYSLLGSIREQYRVDESRIYLTGLSMGGFGTFNLAAKHPEAFAAIAPICGGGDPAEAWKLRNTPVWVFHGAKDNVVPLQSSRQMVEAIRPFNPGIRFTVYPEANHDSWTVTYENDSLYQWFLAHRKFRYKEVDMAPAALQAYTGAYLNAGGDTVRLAVQDGKLLAKNTFHPPLTLKAAAADLFFWQEDQPADVQFFRDKKNAVQGFVLRTDRQEKWTKIPASAAGKKK